MAHCSTNSPLYNRVKLTQSSPTSTQGLTNVNARQNSSNQAGVRKPATCWKTNFTQAFAAGPPLLQANQTKEARHLHCNLKFQEITHWLIVAGCWAPHLMWTQIPKVTNAVFSPYPISGLLNAWSSAQLGHFPCSRHKITRQDFRVSFQSSWNIKAGEICISFTVLLLLLLLLCSSHQIRVHNAPQE